MPTQTQRLAPKHRTTRADTRGRSQLQRARRVLQLVPPLPTDFHPPYFRGVPPMLDAALGYAGLERYVLVEEHGPQ